MNVNRFFYKDVINLLRLISCFVVVLYIKIKRLHADVW